jgi:hypothetical protein
MIEEVLVPDVKKKFSWLWMYFLLLELLARIFNWLSSFCPPFRELSGYHSTRFPDFHVRNDERTRESSAVMV